ncbi:MAG TPA: zonular occludens toxin domain-containing protein [Telluria sp.]
MLMCNEGPPRAGKSYDAVKTHILPALMAGRKVYARLNGLDHDLIAAHLEITPERCRELLVTLRPEEVVPLLVAHGDDPPRFRVEPNSLIVIDEVHEFYVSSRQALPKEQEAFWAKHGHLGLDVLVMTQALGRLHSSIRQRIERKNGFAKLNALGDENKYVVRFYSVGDTMGKFEKISSERHEYDPAIFSLYAGFQPEATNTAAYKAGSKTVWQTVKKPAIVMTLAVIVGIFAVGRFFTGAGTAESAEVKAPEKAQVEASKPAPAPAVVAPIQAVAPVKPVKNLPPTIRYVAELASSARPRLIGVYGENAVVEWRQAQGNAIERFTTKQLEAMGWSVSIHSYGVIANYDDETIVFTAWPIDMPFQQSSATAARIRAAGASLPNGSEEASRTDASGGSSQGAVIGAPPMPSGEKA